MRNRTLTLLVVFVCACAQMSATQYCQIATGHLNDANFGDAAGRILLSLEPTGNTDEYKLTVRANIEDDNTKQVDYLYVTGNNGVTINPNPSISDMEGSGVGSDELYVTFTCTSETADFTIMWSYPDWDGRYQCTVSDIVLSELETCNSTPAQIVYFINAAQWGGVRVVVQTWDESTENWVVSSRGEATLTTEQVNGYDIYSYTLPEGFTRYGLAFQDTQNSDRSHTTTSTAWPEGNPYFCVNGMYDDGMGYALGDWYASLEEYMEAAANAQFRHLHIDDLYYNLNPDNRTAEVTYDAFESSNNYSGLAGTVIPATIEYESVTYNVTGIGKQAFQYCVGLYNIEIPNSVTYISNQAFQYCTVLSNITCHATTPPTCGTEVFTGVNNELPVYVPGESIEDYKAAEGWKDFTNIQAIAGTGQQEIINPVLIGDLYYNLNVGNMTAEVTANPDGTSKYLGDITIPASVSYNGITFSITSIGDSAFYYCSGLTSVAIPNSVISIGFYAFYECPGLTSLILPDDIPGISSYAFYKCSGLTSIVIPNNVTYIEAGAFQYCTSLTSVTFPDNVINIGAFAFDNCRDLTSVNIPNSVFTIDDNAFSWCSSLTGITIGNSVTYIGNEAFYKCYELPKVTIPNSVTGIGERAFSGSNKLTSITCEAITPPTCSGEVSNRVNSVILYVPKVSIEAYQAAEFWSNYTNIRAIGEETAVTVFGITITPEDSTSTAPVDLLGDSTLVYDPEENTLTFSGVEWTVGEDETTAISYTGTETLVIVLNETSTIIADTVISSTADVIITGDGELVAEGTVPIIGVPTATITFDSVTMYVHSTSSPQALRRRIKSGKQLDETGGPALSGFGSVDFNKTNVSPSGALYGPVNIPDGNGGLTATNALYIVNGNGEQEVLTEFYLTAEATDVETVRPNQPFDPTQPAYNILGLQVDASYRGIVIQNGKSFLLLGQ